MLDLDQVKYFLRLLTGDTDTPVTWQVFYDPKGEEQRKDLASHFVATLNQAEPLLRQAQSNKCGVYVGINETDGLGRKIKNVIRYRGLFADYDGMVQPTWPIMPHFTQARDETHGHAFWLVSDIETVEQFRSLQYRIHLHSGTDHQVTDPCRVVRAPGTKHFKDPENPKEYRITGDGKQVLGAEHRYTMQEIIQAFPLTDQQDVELDQWLNSRDAITNGAGFDDTDVSISRFIRWCQVAEPAVQGNGSHTLFKVASMGRDLGLNLETAQALLWEHYDPRCVPPWRDTNEQRDFYDTVERAYTYAKNEPGCRTAKASFQALPAIPPALPPKTEVELTRDGDRLDKQAGCLMTPMLTAKSAHYELAQVFDGVLFNGTNLIRHRKIWYEFNGRSWSPVDDEVIKTKIQRFYSRFKPSDTLTSGIYRVLGDLIGVGSIENGTWLTTGEKMKNTICFKNGLVDLSANPPQLIAHTPNYFTFNELGYDYTPGATCPQWIDFLRRIWDFDLTLIDQLQEFMCYCMISDVSMQKFGLFIGKPRGGKGTITTIIRKLVGENNTCAPSLNNLVKDSALHKMSTCSVALIPDAHSVSLNKRDEVLAILKAIIGGDPVDYHVMYKGTQTSVFKTTFIMSTNGMPEFNDPSGALMARALVFPFYKSFVGQEDTGLSSRLSAELPGIAQWALQALPRLQTNGKFTEAETGLKEKECIKDDLSPLSQFINEFCVEDEDGFTTANDLYNLYVTWAKQNSLAHPLSQNKLTRTINSSHLKIVQCRPRIEGKQVRGFTGLKLKRFENIHGHSEGTH